MKRHGLHETSCHQQSTISASDITVSLLMSYLSYNY